jgi:hypothetical protein
VWRFPLIFIAASALVASALGASPPPVLGGCPSGLLVRPSSIGFCGDGNFNLIRLRWSRWTAKGAAASGVAYENDCSPFCADGHFHNYDVTVALGRPRRCSDHRIEFTRLYYEYVRSRPPGVGAAKHVITAPLNVDTRCP